MCSFLRKAKQGSKFLQTLPLLGAILAPNRYQGLHFTEGKPQGRTSSHMFPFPTCHLHHFLPHPWGVDSHLPVLSQIYLVDLEYEISGQDWDKKADKQTGNLFLGNILFDIFVLLCNTLKPKERKTKNSFTLPRCIASRHMIHSFISNTRDHVLPHFKTAKGELKIGRAAEYFWQTERCFEIWFKEKTEK